MSAAVDGFRLAYDDIGEGDPVVLLHGWPGDRHDFRRVVPLIEGRARLIIPDLRGFGDSDRQLEDPKTAYSAAAQARSILALLDELAIQEAVFAGYDIGSRLIQTILQDASRRVRAVVLTPPLPGAGARLLEPAAQAEFWYQTLHRLPLADDLIDGRHDAVESYLRYIWSHWGGAVDVLSEEELVRIVDKYARPGAFSSSVAWYRSRPGSVASAKGEAAPADLIPTPAAILWPSQDPLFPPAWSDRLSEWFADFTLTALPGSGHFVPLEAPEEFADAVLRLLENGRSTKNPFTG